MNNQIIESIQGNYMLTQLLPPYYRDDPISQDLLNSVDTELDMLFQITWRMLEEGVPQKVTSLFVKQWEEMFAIPTNEADSIEVRVARILSYPYIRQRIRRVDIQAIIAPFLNGARAYILQGYTDSYIVRVNSTLDFSVGDLVYVGGLPVIVTDMSGDEFTFDTQVTTYPFEPVYKERVDITEDFPNYLFYVTVNESAISDLQSLVDAIEKAKPAHLGFRIYGYAGTLGVFDTIYSLLDDPDTTSDVHVLYEDIG